MCWFSYGAGSARYSIAVSGHYAAAGGDGLQKSSVLPGRLTCTHQCTNLTVYDGCLLQEGPVVMSTTGHPLSPNAPAIATSSLRRSPGEGAHPSSSSFLAASLARGAETQRQLQARLYGQHEVYSHSRPQLRVARRRPQKDGVRNCQEVQFLPCYYQIHICVRMMLR